MEYGPSDVPGDAPAPLVPSDHAADTFFPADRMAAARRALMREDRIVYSQALIERLELRSATEGQDYGWEGEASIGTDRDRFVLTSEGEGRFGESLGRAELQGKWRHALDPWFNAEVGVRHDLRPGPQRTYLVVGVEGLAPYWIDTDAQLFLSNKGEAHLRLQAGFDQRITQRLVLRPETEVNVAFQKVRALGITSPVPEWSAGVRLRYEIQPNLAPYVGVEWRKDVSWTEGGRIAPRQDSAAPGVLVGIRTWF